jgi:hypothetical protein
MTEGPGHLDLHWWAKCSLIAAVAAMGWLVPVSNVSAFDKETLIQMSKKDIPASAIKSAIKGDDDFTITPEELGKLKLRGVSSEVLTFLEDNGYVTEEGGGDDQKKAAEETSDESKEGTTSAQKDSTDESKEGTASAQTDTSDETSGDQAAPAPGSGGGGGAAPAPAPGEDQEEEKISKEEMKEKLKQERQEAVEEMKEKERRQKKLQAAARKLPTAKRALDNDNHMKAARIYLEYLSLEPQKNSDNWYEAKFGLGRALFDEGILSGAATPIRQVVMAGSEREHFKAAFRMLEKLTAKIGYQPPMLEQLTQRVIVKDLNKSLRNDFRYYLGRFFHDYNRNELALQYLGKVEKGADDYPEALYLKGATHLSLDNKPEALRDFERSIRAGERDEESNQEILELAYMALARVFYEVGAYDVALFYYQKLPRDSSRYAQALFETAWTYTIKNDFKRALGTFHTLHSPYYDQWYFPDLYVLEATVYLNLCQFDYSKQALAELQQKYLDKRPRLKKFLQETNQPKNYWKTLTKAYDEDGETDSEKLPDRFVNAVLDDIAFYNIYKKIRALRRERQALQTNIDALGDFGQEVLDRVNRQLDTKIREGGILVRDKLKEIDKELQKWETKATQISFDIDSAEKEQLERRLQTQQKQRNRKQAGTTLLIVADDWQPWPFEGEYWFDEVGNYRSKQSSRCIEQ